MNRCSPTSPRRVSVRDELQNLGLSLRHTRRLAVARSSNQRDHLGHREELREKCFRARLERLRDEVCVLVHAGDNDPDIGTVSLHDLDRGLAV